MDLNVFNVDKFNIIQDEENYYFFRALNMADNSDVEQRITISSDGKIERIRTDRERYNGETKYTEDSKISLEEIYDHIKMHYRKDTNCISLTSNANVAVNYARGSYKDKYVMIKIQKKEFGERTVVAGQYMLKELYSRIQQVIENLPEEQKQDILDFFTQIENAKEDKELQNIIAQKYTAKKEELNSDKAHLRKGIKYSSPKSRISSYQSLDEEQLLEVNKEYAKLAILENEKILKHVIPHSSNSKLRETIGNAFSSAEVIHYGEIKQENIIEIPKEVVDIFSLVQQVNGIDKSKLEELKKALIRDVQSRKQISKIPEIDSQVKDNISIEEMYELTEGKVEYGKANSIVKNMFYLSKSRHNAIVLSNALSEILGNNSEFEDIIKHIRKNGFRVEPEIISRKSGKGVKLSESVNLDVEKEEQPLVDEIKKLSFEELEMILKNGGLYNAGDIITRTFSNIRENEKIDKTKYYAEAIIAQYNWQDIGIEEFKISERNELIKRLQDRNCVEIYERLQQAGIEESKIPTILLNIATREGFYEQYVQGNLEQLLNTRQDVLQNNINIEVVERFLGYYDVENTGIRLKDYQQRTFNNINNIFEDKRFTQVILPTGAGKSFVALAQMQKYAQEHPHERMLYLAPQDEILNQIKNYIVKYVHGKQGTVGKTADEIIAEIFPNITFETYSGLLAKRGQEVVKEQYGMIVLDELHRTGAKEWEGKIDTLLENQTDDVKVLGITATPTRDVDGRDMANGTAKKLGYTDEEIGQRKHLASNMTLENAIRMGYVVNPKLVYCKYDLISLGKMDELRAKIDDIEDENKRAEELQKYNELRQKLNKEIDEEIGEEARKKLEEEARKNLDSGIGKEEILRQNVKKGGKYIVFIPVTDQGDIEDENGNRIGTKTGEDKIKAYQDYLNKVFEGTDIEPQLHSLLGSYSKDKNKEEIDGFESDNSDETKFMVVMNKANEGLHIDGVDGVIWFRALDENSRILYLQQLGRAIYALDEDNPLPDDKRPTVIDLANNSLTVKIEKDFENIEPIDDLEALTIVTEWINEHDGMLPDRSSSNKQEQHYYAVLRRIQNKYSKYLDGFDNFEDLTEEDKSRIQEIIDLTTEIDLWNIDLPPIPKSRGHKDKFNPFAIEGVLRDFVEFEDEINNIERKTVYEEVIEFLETHNGKIMKSIFKENGKQFKRGDMTEEQKEEVNLYSRWKRSNENKILEEYAGKPIEKVPEEYRDKISRLREFGLGIKEKLTYEKVIEFLETHNGKIMRGRFNENGKILKREDMTEEQKEEVNLYKRWSRTIERKILEEYTGEPIEKVPEEYREKIAKLRKFGLGIKEKLTYEEVIEFLEIHNGKIMKGTFNENGKRLKREDMTEEQKEESNLYARWMYSNEKKILEEYAGEPIEKVPEEYRDKISRLREFGLGIKEKSTYEEVIEFLETHSGKIMKCRFSENGKNLKREEMTEEQKEEVKLNDRWKYSNENKILEEYAGEPIKKVPEEYRDKISRLREFELGIKEKSTYEEVIEFLETHNGKIMKGRFSENGKNLKREDMTEEQKEESKLYDRWNRTIERKILEEYAGELIEKVPEEYRDKISRLREFGLGIKEKSTYEEVIKFLETHNGKIMKGTFNENGKRLKREDMTEEQKEESNLYARWIDSNEKKILEEYAGEAIEKVPEKYRDKISRLREFGLGIKEKSTYEEVIEFLETHSGKIMKCRFSENGKNLKREEMTEEQKEEVKLNDRWKYSNEKKILGKYAGEPIEKVPEEYRDKISRLREFGLGIKKSKLSDAKQQRDEAKAKNNQAKELEGQVSEQLKKRGKNHEEQ